MGRKKVDKIPGSNERSFPCTYLHLTLSSNFHTMYYARHVPQRFTNIIPFNHLNNNELVLLFLPLKEEELGTKKENSLAKVTQHVNGRARFKPRHSGFESRAFLEPYIVLPCVIHQHVLLILQSNILSCYCSFQ